MKLREDLPMDITYDSYGNTVWSRKDIGIFNKYRKKYKQCVEYAKLYYGKHRCFMVDDPCSIYPDINMQMVASMLIEKKEHIQALIKTETKNVKDRNIIFLQRAYDVVSAIYVPDHIRTMKVRFNGFELKFSLNPISRSLVDILEESRNLDFLNIVDDLEHILSLSNNVKGVIHSQEEEIEIDGIKYNRVIPVQPFLPLVMLAFTDTVFEFSEPCSVYFENCIINNELRNKLLRENLVGWIENCNIKPPLFGLSDGMIGTVEIFENCAIYQGMDEIINNTSIDVPSSTMNFDSTIDADLPIDIKSFPI